MSVRYFVVIINPHDGACEGGDLTECDEERFVDLSLRFDEHAREEQCEPANGQNSGGDELYDSFFHNFYILHFGDIFIAIPFTFHFSFFTFLNFYILHFGDIFIATRCIVSSRPDDQLTSRRSNSLQNYNKKTKPPKNGAPLVSD